MNVLIACRLIMILAICFHDICKCSALGKSSGADLYLYTYMSLSNLPACKLCVVGSSVALYSPANQLLKDLQ